jgi:hypothetical protein
VNCHQSQSVLRCRVVRRGSCEGQRSALSCRSLVGIMIVIVRFVRLKVINLSNGYGTVRCLSSLAISRRRREERNSTLLQQHSPDGHPHGCPLSLALALSFHSFHSYYPRLPFNHRERHLSDLQPPYACHKGLYASSVILHFPFTDLPSHVRITLPYNTRIRIRLAPS